MKVVIKNGIKLIDINIETLSILSEMAVEMKDDVVQPQKITLHADDMFKVLDIIDAHLKRGIISLEMYDSGRFTLCIR